VSVIRMRASVRPVAQQLTTSGTAAKPEGSKSPSSDFDPSCRARQLRKSPAQRGFFVSGVSVIRMRASVRPVAQQLTTSGTAAKPEGSKSPSSDFDPSCRARHSSPQPVQRFPFNSLASRSSHAVRVLARALAAQ